MTFPVTVVDDSHAKESIMPATLTDQALEFLEDPNDRRVHIVRPETMRPLGNGLFEALTVCGERIVGRPVHDASGHPTCAHCLARR